jgi:hypothetical protein
MRKNFLHYFTRIFWIFIQKTLKKGNGKMEFYNENNPFQILTKVFYSNLNKKSEL